MTATINPSRNASVASPPTTTAIDRIHADLDKMVSRLRTEIWLGGILAVGTATLVSFVALLVIDATFQPESAWLRVSLWIPTIGVIGIVTRHFLTMPLRQKCDRLAMAWNLEQMQPAIEERLTTSLQLTNTSNQKTSSIIEAVAEQAHGSLAGCKDEELRGQEVFTRTIVAGACIAAFVLSMWIWAPWLIPSLKNVLNPWNLRALPHLNATIIPGNAHVAEGGDVQVSATANHLPNAVLEIIENDMVAVSHQMATNGGTTEFTLTALKSDRQYRVRSGGLYSDSYQIVVDPKPIIKSSHANLTFPTYTQLPPQVIHDLAEPIEVIHGTRIQIEVDVDSTVSAAEASLSFNGTSYTCEEAERFAETGLWRHRWELAATAGESQRGTITMVSEAGVSSDPFPFEIRILPDLPPSIVIDQPALSDVIAKPDQSIHVAYHSVDDFGFSKLQLTTQRNSEPPSHKELPHAFQLEFGGELTVDLNALELAVGDQLTFWLSISDNRPDEFGGPQLIDSRKIRLQIADDSIPVGQQDVRNETQSVINDLTEALDQLQVAAKITYEFQADLGDTDDKAHQPNDVVEKATQLQNRINDAEQALRRLSEQGELATQRVFQLEIERIQKVTNKEIAEAKKQAGLVPLSDDQPQQQEAIAATKESLSDAIEELEKVREDIDQRGPQLELAAQLDELARQQERITQDQKAGQGADADAQKQQQQIADALQEVVQQDLDARSEQFAQRAEEAAKLTEAAAELQQQQESLALLDQARSKEELDEQLLDMIAREQEQIASETRILEEQQRNLPSNAADATEAAEADQAKIPTALAEAPQQMEAVPEKLRQKDLRQAEAQAQQAGERLQKEAKFIPKKAAAQPNENDEDDAQPKEGDLERLAKQQERVREAIQAVREDRPEEAVAKLQEQIADRTERFRDKADEMLQRPTDDPENQQAVREAREKLAQAEQETKAAEQLAKRQQQRAGDPKNPGEQQQQAGAPKKQGEQQQQTGAPEKSGEQQQQAGDPKKQDEQQQQAGDPKKLGEQQQQAGAPKKPGERQQQAGDPKKQDDQQQQAGDPKKPGEQQQQAGDPEKQAAEQQKQAAKSLQEATQSLEKVCKSCKKCSNCNKPGGSSSSSGGSSDGGGVSSKPGDSKPGDSKPGDSKPGDSKPVDSKPVDSKPGGTSGEAGSPSLKQQQPDSKQLAATTDKAHQAARNPSPHQTQELAQELNQLADAAAERAGYPNRSSKPQGGQSKSPNSSDSNQQAGDPQPGKTSKPQGVQGNAGAGQSEVAPTELRGRSTSNWTQSRRKLKNNVLDDQDSNIPEEFRSVVKNYFEELSRLESRQNNTEENE